MSSIPQKKGNRPLQSRSYLQMCRIFGHHVFFSASPVYPFYLDISHFSKNNKNEDETEHYLPSK